jgi:hypothetical protein
MHQQGVRGYQQAEAAHGLNPFVNPNPVPFYQQAQPQQVNQLMQQQQQAFSQQWQTQNQRQANPSAPQNQNHKESKNYNHDIRPLFQNEGTFGSNVNSHSTNSDYTRILGTGMQLPAPPPPVPKEEPLSKNPPLPPTTQTSAFPQSAQLQQPPDSEDGGKIVSTNLAGLLDIISSSSKKGAVIPGLGDLDELSPPKRKTDESENEKTIISGMSQESKPIDRPDIPAQNLLPHSLEPSRTETVSKSEDLSTAKTSSTIKPSPASVLSDAGSNVSSSSVSGVDFSFGPDGSTGGSTSSYNKSTLKAFDKKFRDWEKQFEDWKKANVGHPDRNAYGKYMGQWEAWREQLVQQRRFIIDNINKERLANIEMNLGKEKVLNDGNVNKLKEDFGSSDQGELNCDPFYVYGWRIVS